jgi:threonine synthase
MGPERRSFPLFPPIVSGFEDATRSYQYPLELDYAYDLVELDRFANGGHNGLPSWQELLPPIVPEISMSEGGTPLLDVSSLAMEGGARIYLKDESRNPTFSHKDRLNLCVISAAKLSGAPGVIAASTGNHGISTAAYAARAGLPCIVLVPEKFSKNYAAALSAFGALAVPVRPSNRFKILSQFVSELGFHPTSNLTRYHTGHPFGPEGYKTLSYEIWLQLKRTPAAIIVPTGYAELLFGIVKGFDELVRLGLASELPRVFSVEPASLAPLATAVGQGQPMAAVGPAETRLTSIACTVSSYRGVWAIEKSKGEALTVSDDQSVRAQARFARAGLWQELSSSAALAAIEQIAPSFAGRDIVVIGTSSGMKDPLGDQATNRVCETFDHAIAYLKDEHSFIPEVHKNGH